MSNKIRNMHIKDSIVILTCLLFLWITIVFGITRINEIVLDKFTTVIIILSGIIICVFATASAIAVVSHLNKNKAVLYKD